MEKESEEDRRFGYDDSMIMLLHSRRYLASYVG